MPQSKETQFGTGQLKGLGVEILVKIPGASTTPKTFQFAFSLSFSKESTDIPSSLGSAETKKQAQEARTAIFLHWKEDSFILLDRQEN